MSSVTIAGLSIDLEGHRIRSADGRETALTGLEVALLRRLWVAQGEPVPKDVLLREVWGYAAGVESRAIDKTVTRLRAKLGAARALLETVPGRGVRFMEPPAATPVFDTPELVGREREIEMLCASLDGGVRLLTILGPGGMGKTALAQVVGHRYLPAAWYAVGERDDPEAVIGGLAASIGAVLAPGRQPAATLSVAARHQRVRVAILDNVEVSLQAVVTVCEALLREPFPAPILVTSRARLGLSDEQAVELGPLDPEAAGRLFQRAVNAHVIGAKVVPDEARPLLEALEGIPLALELAAAWTRVLSLPEIGERFGAHPAELHLPGQPGARLSAVVDRSRTLLSRHERAALDQIAVFRGGFDLAAAEQVLELGPGSPGATALVLALRDRSFVHSVGATRFSLYDALRDPAVDEVVRDRHARWATAMAKAAWRSRHGWDEVDPGVQGELRNLEAARQHVWDQDAQSAALLASTLAMVLCSVGRIAEAVSLTARAKNLPADGLARWRSLITQVSVGWMAGVPWPELQSIAEDALALGRTLGPQALVTSLHTLAEVVLYQNDLDGALRHVDEAALLALELGPAFAARHFGLLAAGAEFRGDQGGAVDHLGAGVPLALEAGLRVLASRLELRRIGLLVRRDADEARRAYDRQVPVVLALPFAGPAARGRVLQGLGGAAVELGRWSDAEQWMRQAALEHHRAGDELGAIQSLAFLWCPLAAQGDLPGAATVLHQAIARARDRGQASTEQMALYWVFKVSLAQGDRVAAERALERSEWLGGPEAARAGHARCRAALAALDGDVVLARAESARGEPVPAPYRDRVVELAEAVAAGRVVVRSGDNGALPAIWALELRLLEDAFRAVPAGG